MSTMRLADGRTLAWAEYGDPAGWPVLYCHGTPGCGAEIDLVFAGAWSPRAGMRLIAPDRPGMGRWGFKPSGDTPRLHIWQGTEGTTGARPAMAEHPHAALPGSQLHLGNDGHLSVVVSQLEEVLCTIAGSSASIGNPSEPGSEGSQLGRPA